MRFTWKFGGLENVLKFSGAMPKNKKEAFNG